MNVHEGPQSISKNYSNVELQEGMIVSNEPGFYKNGEYGIRIENLVLVKKSKIKNFPQKPFWLSRLKNSSGIKTLQNSKTKSFWKVFQT